MKQMPSSGPHPPRLTAWLLNRMSRYKSEFDWAADLEEEFLERVRRKGARKARGWYRRQVIRSLPAYVRQSVVWSLIMFKNYYVTSFRNFKRNAWYSVINLSGLAVGVTCCILIFLWVQEEWSYDRFHQNADSLHVVLMQVTGTENFYTHGPGPLGPALEREYPEIIDACRVFGHAPAPLKYQDRLFTSRVLGVDPSFFDMFSFPLAGEGPQNPLSDRQSMVLTKSTADRLFGAEDPLGKTVSFEWWGTWHDFRVTAVLEDIPSNTLFEFDLLLPFDFVTLSGMTIDDWDVAAYYTYVQLPKQADAAAVGQKIAGTMTRHFPPSRVHLSLYPITRLHLYDPNGEGPIIYVYLFSCIGILILAMACINFINLTTARSEKRAREVGLRKVVGAVRPQLVKQFMGESLLLAALAGAAAVLMTLMLLPRINILLEKQLTLRFDAGGLALMGSIVLLTGLAAGAYPALLISSLKPSSILRGSPGTRTQKSLLRKALVVSQFAISILLLIATAIIYRQLHFMRHADIGLNIARVINMELRGGLRNNYYAIKTRLLQHPGIHTVSATNGSFFKRFGTKNVRWEGKDPESDIFFAIHAVDHDYADIFDLRMVQGRYFSRDFPSDLSDAFIINETAARVMGMDAPLGKRIFCPLPFDGDRDGLIVGVVKDFHFRSLHEEIQPLILAIAPGWFTDMYIRINPEHLPETVGFIESVLTEMAPDFPLEYTFLNEDIARLYRVERHIGFLVRYGAALAVFIACLGLFGMAAYSAEQRTKEIGIRKVMGSSVPEIIILLIKELLRWVIQANLVAWPVAYIAARAWLQSFAYRIKPAFEVFLLSGTAALVIALLTVSYQTLRAALADPVESLRYE